MSAKMLLSDVYWNLYTSLMYIGHWLWIDDALLTNEGWFSVISTDI
jgi:hypothetical protein